MKYLRMNIALCLLLFSTTISLGAGPTHAQPRLSDLEALKQDLETVKKDLGEIKKALSEMRQLLTQRPVPPAQSAPAPPAVTKVSVGRSPSLGRPNAPITIVEFSDYQCPFCQRFFATTLPALRKDYIDTGKVRDVFRDFPLDSIHPQARKAHEAAHCAGEQGKYWEMHDRLFQNQRSLGVVQLKGHARELGLELAAFEPCLEQGTYAAEVNKNVAEGAAAGVSGTPSFFVGKTAEDGTIEGTLVRGAQPITAFRQAIDWLLEGQKP
jgi:protein-disulfide isomerase